MLEKTEGRWSLRELAEMPLPQLAALEHQRTELTFAEAVAIIKQRKKDRGKTG